MVCYIWWRFKLNDDKVQEEACVLEADVTQRCSIIIQEITTLINID